MRERGRELARWIGSYPARAQVKTRAAARFKAVLGLALFLVVFVSFFIRARATTDQLAAFWLTMDVPSVASSFALVAACFVWAGVLWHVTLHLLGGRLKLAISLRIYFLSSLPRYVPGSIWGYVSRTYLGLREGVERGATVLSVVVEIAFFVSSGIVFASIAWIGLGALIQIIAIVAGVAGAGLAISAWAIPAARHIALPRARAAAKWGLVGLAYVGFWAAYGFSVVLLVRPYGAGAASLDTLRIMSGFSIAWLIGFVAVFVPGGLGVREAGLALILEPMVGSLTALNIAVLSRLLNMLADALMFSLAFPVWRRLA